MEYFMRFRRRGKLINPLAVKEEVIAAEEKRSYVGQG